MGTLFEVWLAGDDEEHLGAVGEAILDEVERLERLLSRHDPAAEVARVNRGPAGRPVLVDRETLAILADCLAWYERTEGHFDVCAATRPAARRLPEVLQLDTGRRTATLACPGLRLDLGGYGKGLALDRAARLLDAYGVNAALLHGGTSSVLARGAREGMPWVVALRDPFLGHEGELARLPLADRGLSTSVLLPGNAAAPDIIAPGGPDAPRSPAGCVVLAPTALGAEVLSTALVAMGQERARGYLRRAAAALPGPLAVAWLEQHGNDTALSWILE